MNIFLINLPFAQKIVIFVSILNVINAVKIIPDDVVQCKFEDASCLLKSFNHVTKTHAATGIPELNVVPFDPLRIDTLKVEKNTNSPVNIELNFADVNILGLQKAKFTKINGFDAELKKDIEIHATVSNSTLKGTYTIDGTVLILPIVGKGNSELILYDLLIMLKIRPKAVIKDDGHKYFTVGSIKLKMLPKGVFFNLENLFSGDKVLSETMNTFINENGSDIFKELEPKFSAALAKVVVRFINATFSKYPFQDYFLK